MPTTSTPIELTHGEGTPSHAIIWLHGLGAGADDFVPVVPMLNLAPSRIIRFVFPQAPTRPITVNGGMMMPGWYDIKGMDISDKEDITGMQDSQSILDGLIDQQIAQGIAAENIVIAGFSQGGAVAYYTAVRSSHKLGGVLALSTYLPFASQVEKEHSNKNLATSMLAMHGIYDQVVPVTLGKQSAEVLTQLGYSLTWREYPMEHNVIPEQLTDIGKWISATFDD